jgi:hypothetical protein
MIEAGIDVKTISERMGHVDGGALVLRTYGHLYKGRGKQAALQLEQLVTGGSGMNSLGDRGPGWTLEQATELVMEQFVSLLDGCDDDDTVRAGMIFEALRQAWAPNTPVEAWDETITAGDVRRRLAAARHRLAEGELIP